MRSFTGAIALSLLAVVNAALIDVQVGANSTLTYTPSSVTAANGDVIVFHFVAKNHTVTQSSFANPCTALSPGANSGFHPATATSQSTFNFTVTNSSAPTWFYCAQTGHCVNGMVFAVNPTAAKSFAAFQAAAKALNPNSTSSSSSPAQPGYGGYGTASSGSSPTASGSSASPSSSQASSAMRLRETAVGVVTAAALVFGLVL